MSETFPTGEAPTPVSPVGGGAGCFGNGIGALDYQEREMELLGSDFIGIGTIRFSKDKLPPDIHSV